MKYCRGFQCPNKKQCKCWNNYINMKNNKDPIKKKIINKCLNSKEFISNG